MLEYPCLEKEKEQKNKSANGGHVYNHVCIHLRCVILSKELRRGMHAAPARKNDLNHMVSVLADDILKNVEYDALRIVFNKFQSVVSFVPTVATLLSPEVVEKEAKSGGKLSELDSYEIGGDETK
ncbi:unnamed protein product [Ilex paraguariensis]|uniref:Uncharacterized protein n=1 Tax=Ilex paraguariensis TaxID=185542 RepID=A0ABC8SV79_9AQUA